MPKRCLPMCPVLLAVLLLFGCARGATIATPAAPTATSVPATATIVAMPAALPSPTATATPITPTATGTPVPPATPRAAPSASPASPTRGASPNAVAATTQPPARPGPPVYPTQPRALGQPVAQTTHYQFFDPEGTHGATITLYVAEAEAIYAYVADRTGLQATAPIPIVLQTQATDDCAARGIAYRNGLRISIFDAPTTPVGQLRMVLAHETTHILHMPHTARYVEIRISVGPPPFFLSRGSPIGPLSRRSAAQPVLRDRRSMAQGSWHCCIQAHRNGFPTLISALRLP